MIDVPKRAAVEVRDAVKSYVKGEVVINHMNMTVPKGTIYGLLGSSGCGKTSILSCIVGLRQLDSGQILVFGKEPGTKESGIPGNRLGFMPQDIALYPNFTIREILLYFGRIYGMQKNDIMKRVEFLSKFLQLPASSKRISSLSGGQQRRTSLATAFVHDPELLILDEPTVGVDPILRMSIWDHLCAMTNNGRTTVIVTTHYIEEARRSDTIGLMRNGRLLAENSPQNLLNMFNVPFLEDIVLELCRKDHARIKQGLGASEGDHHSSDNNENCTSPYPRPISKVRMKLKLSLIPFLYRHNTTANGSSVAESENCDCVVVGFDKRSEHVTEVGPFESQQKNRKSVTISNKETETTRYSSSQRDRINSLIRRNCIYFARNITFILMLLIFPALQTALVAVTIGGDPKNMSLGVVNQELPDWEISCKSQNFTCSSGAYSCRLLKALESSSILHLIPFSSKEDAIQETKHGKIYGLLSIPENYTQHVVDRDIAGLFPSSEDLDGSTLNVNLDMSNYVASVLIIRQLYSSLESYGMQLAGHCEKSPQELKIPLHYREPVYGRLDSDYTEYVTPGALIMILFLIPMCTCGLAFVADKRQGTMERSMVAGTSAFEMMVSYFVTDGLIIIFQTSISSAIIIFGFNFKVQGSFVLYGLLCLLTGVCGQAWGFVFGIICPDEASLLITAFTLHFPLLLQGGIIWPLEGISKYMRYFSHCLPVTASLHSLRSIVARGFGLSNIRVWSGFAIICAWIITAWIVAIVKYRRFRK